MKNTTRFLASLKHSKAKMGKWLSDEKLWVRSASLWCVCFLLLTVMWFLSYYFLPFGLLRGVFPQANLPVGNDLLSAFLAIFIYNLAVGGGFSVAANLLSLKSIPLGYAYPLVQTSLYGIFLGTDSFGVNQGADFFRA
jgi:hypothetical protein